MTPDPTATNELVAETRRLAALQALGVLDTLPEPEFDEIVATAAQVCGVPVALISLIDAQRQWFKAGVGLPAGVTETPRDIAFCDHAIRDSALFEVPDATRDARFADNPLVTGEPDIRFYAGAPIVMPGGERIGTVCVIDRAPRRLDEHQRRMLHSLARIVASALQHRQRLREVTRLLSESESQYRAIVEDQSELIARAQRDGALTFVNAAYARHFGVAPMAMIGRSLFDFVADADRQQVRAHLEAMFDGGEPTSNVNRMKSADGTQRWVAWTNRPVLDAAGRAIGLQSVGRDITEQRRAEEELAASEQRARRTHAHLDAVVDNMPALLGYWDAAQVTRFANRDFQAAVGLPTDRILGRALPEVFASIDPQGYAAIAPHVADVLGGRRQEFECAMLTTSGLRQMRVVLVPAQPTDGHIDGFHGSWFDITGLKALELRLRDSEQRYRTLFDHLGSAYALQAIEVDAQGRPVDYRYLAANPAFCAMFEVDSARIVGARATAVFAHLAADLDEVIGQFGRVALTGTPAHFEQHSSVSGRWFEVIAYQTVPGQFAVIVQDISARKRLEETLAAAQARIAALEGSRGAPA